MATPPNKLDLEFMELIIIFNAMFNQAYLTTIIDIIDIELFDDYSIKAIFKVVLDFYDKTGEIPTTTEVKAHLTTDSMRSAFKDLLQRFKHLDTKYNQDELLANTEQFFRERSVYTAVKNMVEKYASGETNIDTTDAFDQFSKACNISLIDDLGHDYFNDVDEYIERLQKVEHYISTGYEWLDKMLSGGLLQDGRALYVFSGVTNSGKSIILGNLAANICAQNKTAIIISLEMSEDMYAKRITSQMSNIPIREVANELDAVGSFIKDYKEDKPNANLFIKEFPPKSVTVNHIRAYIEKLIRKKDIKPSVVVIDYVNLISPRSATGSSYTDVKGVTEQLRALSYVLQCPIVTATQLGRGAFDKSDPGLEYTSESMGLAMTADAQFAIWSDDSDKELGIIHMGCQKNRFGPNFGRNAFKIDYDTLTITTMNDEFVNSEYTEDAESSIEKIMGV